MTQLDTDELLSKIFMPHAWEQSQRIKRGGVQFSHYTSAETGIRILKKRRIWLRNASLMNDHSETQYGQRLLTHAWHKTESGALLQSLLCGLDNDLTESFKISFDDQQYIRQNHTFLLCLSEHATRDSNERKCGRLSMWRAYGGDTNIAMVLKSNIFFSNDIDIPAYISPVCYATQEAFDRQFEKFANRFNENLEFLKSNGLVGKVFEKLSIAFHFSALSTKHPGFREEQEWRVIISDPLPSSPLLESSIECVAGLPQKVLKIRLDDAASDVPSDLSLKRFLDKIIIGPTLHAQQMKDTFVSVLDEQGFESPDDMVIVSDIPLRR